ncbi:hypothetical protein Clacol_004575 [Clathrus columnatus]|uniref:Carboxylesterase type B domain-containing protein n=1 Tax=Clathrus columnatus TaxID=1419009 RepID=A0AAV5A6U9_9AGAM|nr:hypothetical protein Clacol_004575 [Clathrus columnatus]
MGLQTLSTLTFTCLLLCRSALGLNKQFIPPGPQINLGYVSLVGNATTPSGEVNGTVDFFGNVPYAQPPLGSLRFRAPQPLNEEPIKDQSQVPVLDARSWGPPCIQQDPATVGVGSEDCLLLNVWKPSTAKAGDKLPVMVYIYGGGFYAGTTQGFPMYDWVAQSQEIVAVSMGYRLNIFGFLTSPAMNTTDLNAGLLDQRAALEWVQRHISQFGGDPDTVTIIGEKPVPFKRAISESIGYGPTPTKEQSAVALPESILETAAMIAGCPLSGLEALECLRQASLGSLISALNTVAPGQFGPIVSGPGTILPELPAALIREGKFALVDYVGGHCSNDGRTFTNGTPTTLLTEAQLIAAVLDRWPSLVRLSRIGNLNDVLRILQTNDTINKMLALYPAPGTPGSPFDTEYDRTWVIEQDAVFGCMDWFLANRTSQLGHGVTFNFRFNAPNPVLYAQTPYQGVMHTSDLFFLSAPNAGYTFKAFNSTELPLSQEIIAYWTSFGRSGNPSQFKETFSPDWPGQRTGQRVVMTRNVIPNDGTASSVESISAYEMERCLFWMSEEVTSQTML